LTGKPPFVGETPAATPHKHCKQTPPRVTEFALDCPLSMERLIARLLEKTVERRPQSAADVARELRAVSSTVEVRAPRGRDLTAGIGNNPVTERTDETASRTEISVPTIPGTSSAALDWRWLAGAIAVLLLLVVWIVRLYGMIGPGDAALGLWRQSLGAGEIPVRVQAALALGEIAQAEDLRKLSELLESDPDAALREACAMGLGRADVAAAEFVPQLMRVRNADEEQRVRIAADQAIKAIQRD
jgi:serine/threonine-protein kinase